MRDLAQRYPKQFEIVETLGLIYAERGQLERAVPFLEAGCSANPTSPEAAANLGVAYLKLNHIASAVSRLAYAAALDPTNADTESSYGHALMAARRPAAAAAVFAKAAAAKPNDTDILYNLAVADFAAGHAADASQVLAEVPQSARTAQIDLLCGDVEEKLRRFDRALACLQRAAQLDESEANLNALGLELIRHWSFEAAAEIFQYAISKYPSSGRLRSGLGISFYASSQYSQAAHIFSALLVDSPSTASAKLLGWSCIAVKAGSDEDCQALLTYATAHPSDADAGRLAAGMILTRHDESKFPLARTFLEHAIAADPHTAESFYYMGVLDQEQSEWRESVAMLKRADALRPNSSKTHLRLALAYSHLGNHLSAHDEAEMQRHLRQLEDEDMETRRERVETFVLQPR